MGKLLMLTILVVPLLSVALVYFNLHTPIISKIKEFSGPVLDSVSSASKTKRTAKDPSKSCLADGEELFTKDDLAQYTGVDGSLGLYLGLLGVVYDVEKGRSHYGPGKGYSFFCGRDASRSFITGEFEGDGLDKEDVQGLELESFEGLRDWVGFYEKTYVRKGRIIGLYYDENGCPTNKQKWVQQQYKELESKQQKQTNEEEIFPPCNSEWSQDRGKTRVWCTSMTTGTERGWIGVPRQYFNSEKKMWRCACVRNEGPPTVAAIVYEDDEVPSDTNDGDLGHPRLKQYPNCDPKSTECIAENDV